MASFIKTGFYSDLTETALALVAIKEGKCSHFGNATVIGPYFAITARHVLEEYWKMFERKELKENIKYNANHSIRAFQFCNKGKEEVQWNIIKSWFSPITDIAFLWLAPKSSNAPKYKWTHRLRMNLIPPKKGSVVAGFGYRKISIEEPLNEGSLILKELPATTVGEVTEIHDLQRDSGALTFPCFMTDAKLYGGMSGGPVFNETGELCGILCYGSDPNEENKDYSYAASLWPSMSTKINLPIKGYPEDTDYPVLELAKNDFLSANWDRVEIVKKEDGISQTVLKIDQ